MIMHVMHSFKITEKQVCQNEIFSATKRYVLSTYSKRKELRMENNLRAGMLCSPVSFIMHIYIC